MMPRGLTALAVDGEVAPLLVDPLGKRLVEA